MRPMDGTECVMIGTDTEGSGLAHMPERSITTHPNQEMFPELTFPDFLRTPTEEGGDIIPPTPV